MKFRNIDKRQHEWETPRQKQAERTQRRAVLQLRRRVEAEAERLKPFIIPLADAMCRALSSEAPPRVEAEAPLDSDDIQPLGGAPMTGKNWVRYFAFIFFHLRRRLQGFWSAPRFTHPAAWLMVSRNKSWP